MPGRTMHSQYASLPFPFPNPAYDTVSEWSWSFRRKSDLSEETETRRSHRYYTSARTGPLRAGREELFPQDSRTRRTGTARRGCAPHADQTPRGGRRPLSARPTSQLRSFGPTLALSPAFRLHKHSKMSLIQLRTRAPSLGQSLQPQPHTLSYSSTSSPHQACHRQEARGLWRASEGSPGHQSPRAQVAHRQLKAPVLAQ